VCQQRTFGQSFWTHNSDANDALGPIKLKLGPIKLKASHKVFTSSQLVTTRTIMTYRLLLLVAVVALQLPKGHGQQQQPQLTSLIVDDPKPQIALPEEGVLGEQQAEFTTLEVDDPEAQIPLPPEGVLGQPRAEVTSFVVDDSEAQVPLPPEGAQAEFTTLAVDDPQEQPVFTTLAVDDLQAEVAFSPEIAQSGLSGANCPWFPGMFDCHSLKTLII